MLFLVLLLIKTLYFGLDFLAMWFVVMDPDTFQYITLADLANLFQDTTPDSDSSQHITPIEELYELTSPDIDDLYSDDLEPVKIDTLFITIYDDDS